MSDYSAKRQYIGLSRIDSKPELVIVGDSFHISNVTPIDIDQDGDMDILANAVFEDRVFLWNNSGLGALVLEEIDFPNFGPIHSVDLDDDGIKEFIVGSGNSVRIFHFMNNHFQQIHIIDDDIFLSSAGAIDVTDLNSDGQLDVVVTYSFGGLIVYYHNNLTDYTRFDIAPESFRNDDLVIADLNNDQMDDFLLYSSFELQAKAVISKEDGSYNEILIPDSIKRGCCLNYGDIDLDGDIDMFFGYGDIFDISAISIFINQNGQFEEQVISQDYFRAEFGEIRDLDQDGDNDLYFYSNGFFDSELVIFYNQSIITSVKDIETSNIKIAPNPVRNNIFITHPNNIKYELFMMDSFGRKVLEARNISSIDVSNYDAGVYTLVFKDDTNEQIFLNRIIVMH